ncbi:MAG: GntR family transcriptional regulator [Proteobacteria bacterium]|nr:GntR family transcriptional regulator [Pseudomonadota bacterium]
MAERHIRGRDGLPDAIARALREAIFEGVFAANERLHQDDIAQQFGVSRVPVREALAKLVTEGLAVQRFNKGIRVAPLSRADFQDIMELRALLEPNALRLSAPHLGAADYDEAERILEQVRPSALGSEAAASHWMFHNRLYSRSGRPRLLAQISSLQIAINRYVLPIWRTVGLSSDWGDTHHEIVYALRSGDVDEAARMTGAQIEHAMHRMIDQLPMTVSMDEED